jgi:hypothetical protein
MKIDICQNSIVWSMVLKYALALDWLFLVDLQTSEHLNQVRSQEVHKLALLN